MLVTIGTNISSTVSVVVRCTNIQQHQHNNNIIVLNELQAVEVLRQMNGVTHPWTLKFIHYSQSNACEYKEDSSVSYAAGVLFSKP